MLMNYYLPFPSVGPDMILLPVKEGSPPPSESERDAHPTPVVCGIGGRDVDNTLEGTGLSMAGMGRKESEAGKADYWADAVTWAVFKVPIA